MPSMGCCSNFFRYIGFGGGMEHCRIGNEAGIGTAIIQIFNTTKDSETHDTVLINKIP